MGLRHELSNGFTRPTASVVTVVTLIASLGLLSVAMRMLPLGIAYTVWTGIGAIGAFVVTPLRVTAAVLIVTGLVAMKLAE